MRAIGRIRVLITTSDISSAKTNGFAIWYCPVEGVVTPGEVSLRLAVQNKPGDDCCSRKAAVGCATPWNCHSHKGPPNKEGTWDQRLDLILILLLGLRLRLLPSQ